MYVYMITNNINGKRYIGITNNIVKRWSNHRCGNSSNMAIGKAIKKYGVDNFTFEILESNVPIEEIDQREVDYIKKYNTHTSNGQGYNVSRGGRYFQGYECDNEGEKNNNAHLTKEEAEYIKSHRDLPMYVLYDDFSEKLSYEAFKNVYKNKTYKNISPTVPEYPYNNEFSGQFATTGKLNYDEVVALRNQYLQLVPWKEAYTEKYQKLYPDPMCFWNVYNGNRYKLVMPEIFTAENKKKHSQMQDHSGEKNGRAKLTWDQVHQIRYDFEQGIKTRKELQKEYNFVSPASINSILRYQTWKEK